MSRDWYLIIMHIALVTWLVLAFFANREGDAGLALYYLLLAVIAELHMILARQQR